MTGQSPLPPDIVRDLNRIEAATKGPFGPPSLRALVRDHIALFVALRSQDASWKQIGTLLAEHGVAGSDGKPVAAAILRTTVSAVRPRVDAAGLRVDGNRNDAQRNEAQCSEAQCTAMRRLDFRDLTQRNETKCQDARRSEPNRNEAQRRCALPQHHTSSQHSRPRAPSHEEEIEPGATASQRPPHRFLSLPAELDKALVRRAERVERLKEDY